VEQLCEIICPVKPIPEYFLVTHARTHARTHTHYICTYTYTRTGVEEESHAGRLHPWKYDEEPILHTTIRGCVLTDAHTHIYERTHAHTHRRASHAHARCEEQDMHHLRVAGASGRRQWDGTFGGESQRKRAGVCARLSEACQEGERVVETTMV